jgi:hypothetical protein
LTNQLQRKKIIQKVDSKDIMLGITLCSGARGDIGEDSGVPIEI